MASPGSPMFDSATKYFNAGQYPQAADLYEQDLRLNPQDPLTHYYLGVSLHCMGRVPEATREYNWILLNTQDPELIRRAQLGLQALVRQIPSGLPPAATQLQAASGLPPAATIPPPASGLPPAATIPPPASGLPPAATMPVTAGNVPTQKLATASGVPLTKDRESHHAAAHPVIGPTGHMRIVDCYTVWCGWCHKFEPLFKKAQAKYKGRITFERVDAEAAGNEEFVNTYKVHSYPTILFFDASGRLVNRINGAPQTFDDFDQNITHYFPGVH